MKELAAEKLKKESTEGKYDQCAAVMKPAVLETLLEFCRQNEEFAQAVYQGGSFADCMAAVADGAGSSISDLEAYRKAVRFYFPGADIKYSMTVNLCASVEQPEKPKPDAPMLLDLTDFL